MLRTLFLSIPALLALATSAVAAPIVAIDADPLSAGTQSTIVTPGSGFFEVDVVISGVDASAPLNGFQFDLFFDPTVVVGVSVMDGGFLQAPVITVQKNIGTLSIEFAEVTLGAVGSVGAGVLAKVGFSAVAPGTTKLDLSNVILSAPFGQRIAIGSVVGGAVTAIPEPSGALLFATGLLVSLRGIARRRG